LFVICVWLHRWSGLVATPFFVLLCLTGSILIFHDEIDHLLGTQAPPADVTGPSLSLETLARSAVADLPNHRPISIFLDDEQSDRAFVRVGKMGFSALKEGTTVLIDRHSGNHLAFHYGRGTLTGFVFDLHANWLAGVPGELFGGAIALLVLVCLVTGLVVYAPYLRRQWLGTIRWNRSPRIVHLDLHNLLGAVVLGWALLVATTGLCLASGSLLVSLWKETDLRSLGAPQTPPSLTPVSVDRATAAAEALLPDRIMRFVVFPNTDFSSPEHYTIYMYGGHRYDEKLFTVVLVEAATGKVTAVRGLPLYLKFVVFSQPLHFGDYGGLTLKLFWLASVAGTLFITGNGAYLWWLRYRRTGHAAVSRA
jgi:uncharacterized iron-regulated membrane protein